MEWSVKFQKKDLGVDQRFNLFSLTLCTTHFSRGLSQTRPVLNSFHDSGMRLLTINTKIKEM